MMKQRSFNILATLLLISATVCAQTGLTGFVLDQDGMPIEGVKLDLRATNTTDKETYGSVETDEHGHFMMPVKDASKSYCIYVADERFPNAAYPSNQTDRFYGFENGSWGQTVTLCNVATFRKDRLSTILLPTAPDASLGRYYRLDRLDDSDLKVYFERERNPQPNTPYVIIPDRDFRISYSDAETGESMAATEVKGAILQGYHKASLFMEYEDYYHILFDTTPDCREMKNLSSAFVGNMRAVFIVNAYELDASWLNYIYTTRNWREEWQADHIIFHDEQAGTAFTLGEQRTAETALVAPTAAQACLSGFVLNQDRQPVAQATVRLKSVDGTTEYSAVTDAYGHYLMEIKENEKSYQTHISAEGYPDFSDSCQLSFTGGSQVQGYTICRVARYVAGKRATIILPATPDPALGRYYRLVSVEGRRVNFEEEPAPQANTPYIIIPKQDFEIDYSQMSMPEQAGETAVEGARLVGVFSSTYFASSPQSHYILAEETVNGWGDLPVYCEYSYKDYLSSQVRGCRMGALHAVLALDAGHDWGIEKLETRDVFYYDALKYECIVLNNTPSGIISPTGTPAARNGYYTLCGQRLSARPEKGVYIKNGRKYVATPGTSY